MNIDPKSETPRIFLLNRGLGDLVLNPHKPHTEWVYASDAITEYVQSENQRLTVERLTKINVELVDLLDRARNIIHKSDTHFNSTDECDDYDEVLSEIDKHQKQ